MTLNTINIDINITHGNPGILKYTGIGLRVVVITSKASSAFDSSTRLVDTNFVWLVTHSEEIISYFYPLEFPSRIVHFNILYQSNIRRGKVTTTEDCRVQFFDLMKFDKNAQCALNSIFIMKT